MLQQSAERELIGRMQAGDSTAVADLASAYGPKIHQLAFRYVKNWEDAEEFKPYLYVDVTGELEEWRRCVTQYEFIRGGISSFPYLDYYEALARIRGAESGKRHAVAFEVNAWSKRRVIDSLP